MAPLKANGEIAAGLLDLGLRRVHQPRLHRSSAWRPRTNARAASKRSPATSTSTSRRCPACAPLRCSRTRWASAAAATGCNSRWSATATTRWPRPPTSPSTTLSADPRFGGIQLVLRHHPGAGAGADRPPARRYPGGRHHRRRHHAAIDAGRQIRSAMPPSPTPPIRSICSRPASRSTIRPTCRTSSPRPRTAASCRCPRSSPSRKAPAAPSLTRE